MRPIFFPSISCTVVPTRSSTLPSIAGLFVTATGNALDDVARKPDLPRNRAGVLCRNVELDVATHGLDVRPRNANLLQPPGSPPLSHALRQATESWVHPVPRNGAADRDMRHVRLRALSDVHHQTVHASHRLAFAVEQLLVENIAHEFHL